MFPLPFCHSLQFAMHVFLFFLDFKAFQEASERFQPYIKFFATFDKSVSISRQNRESTVIVVKSQV